MASRLSSRGVKALSTEAEGNGFPPFVLLGEGVAAPTHPREEVMFAGEQSGWNQCWGKRVIAKTIVLQKKDLVKIRHANAKA